MRFNSAAISVLIAAGLFVFPQPVETAPVYTIEQAVAVAQAHNPDILIARKRVQGARGSWIEARAGFLPSVSSSGLYDKRQTQSETTLRQEEYNAIMKLQRAEVALANERPKLFNAQTQLRNSYLRLGDLFGFDARHGEDRPASFGVAGELTYQSNHADLNDCLARADANRAAIKARQKDIEIEDKQYILDRSAMRPQIRAFSGYEIYSERDPAV